MQVNLNYERVAFFLKEVAASGARLVWFCQHRYSNDLGPKAGEADGGKQEAWHLWTDGYEYASKNGPRIATQSRSCKLLNQLSR